MVDFNLSSEDAILIKSTEEFVKRELMIHEDEIERTDYLPKELMLEIRKKAIDIGLHACNMPENVGGLGLGAVSVALIEKELGRTSLALAECVHRPLNIFASAVGMQREAFLYPIMRGEMRDCIAMTEPDAGSDIRSMKTFAKKDGDDWVIRGTKHFISNASLSDCCVLFAATGEENTNKGVKKKISAFLIDFNDKNMEVREGYKNVSHRGYTNNILHFDDCRIPSWRLLGEEGEGFKLMNDWLGPTRLTVAATSVARAERAYHYALHYSTERKQFNQQISKFQAISFPLADMATKIRLANLLLLESAWKVDQNIDTMGDCAQAKLYCTEILAQISDQAIQIVGGMGLMDDLPLERIWRDARVERIWDGTSEIQRHIISREILRKLGG